ncbi:hypothetical protein RB195_021057 [Necator americanus]|uniref:Arf-GAP domain-containing protein n=1 Tax=Necator americanus TaxID=51031 RepID=A0ABR1E9F3_NECAM
MVNCPPVLTSGSTLSAQKKRQDEKNLRTLRELAALPANRFCFECGQCGPTYVNITHGSFCCSSCSGILRGLNPPHRVKSICMATFTCEEIERIRNLGNEENSHTWLGLYSGSPPKMTNKEEIATFLIKKYEKKEWYVSRSELEEQERLLNQAKEVASQCGTSVKSAGSSSSKPADLDLFATDPFATFGVPMTRTPATQTFTDAVVPPEQATNPIPPQPFSPPAFVAPPPPLPSKPPVQSNSFTSKIADSFRPVDAKTTSDTDPFADFDARFSELALKNSSTVSAFGSPLPAQSLPKSATVNTSFHLNQIPTQSTNPFSPEVFSVASFNSSSISEPVPINTSTSDADKYSALAELDQMFHHGGQPNSSAGEKPTWLPSGFSTGLPPAHYTPVFNDASKVKVAKNVYGHIPKSNTLGAIAEVGATAISHNAASSDNIHQQTSSISYANLAPNPFLAQSIEATNASHANFIVDNGPEQKQIGNVMWNNPFASNIVQAHCVTGNVGETTCQPQSSLSLCTWIACARAGCLQLQDPSDSSSTSVLRTRLLELSETDRITLISSKLP